VGILRHYHPFQARILRKTLGGGMRQVGVLCAAAYVAVRDTVGKLADDHRKAKALAGFKNLVVFSFFLSFESNFTSFLLCTVHKH
jgi:threonine aldolase